MLGDLDAAADCVQDVFCTAATRLLQLDGPEKLRAWLYAIARDEALRRLRDYRRELPTAEQLPAPESFDPGPPTPVAGTRLGDLIADTGGLSDRERAVLQLAYRHGLDGPELADALGVSAATAVVHRLGDTIQLCRTRS